VEPKAVETSYARWAPVYDRTFGALTHGARRHAVEHINTRQGQLLEVGVGTGLSLEHYHPGLRVTGIDFSADMLEKARDRVAARRLDHVVELRQMDARALDFPDNSFDTVAAMHVLSVVPEPETVMAEIARVLKPGGQVVITNHFKRQNGILGLMSEALAPMANVIGWHADFEMDTVLRDPRLTLESRRIVPPLGLMTFMILTKRSADC
jgi:phosphatidylethanolamine/phosphatidyl-N-methylethanolamine N-methyltransferase